MKTQQLTMEIQYIEPYCEQRLYIEDSKPSTDATLAAQKQYWENKAIEADQHLLELHAHQLETGSVVLEDPESREQLTEETD